MSIMRTGKILLTATMLAGPLVLAGCGGGSDTETEVPEPMPSAYETATAAIAAATTAAEAQAAYDAVKNDVTAAEGDMLQAAVDARAAALAMMAREADQKAALAMAADAIDTSDLTTAEAIGATRAAIAALQAALDAAADVSDADKAMYQTALDNANTAVGTAQAALDLMGRQTVQRTAISNAVTAALAAVNAVNDDSSDAEVMAADNAIAALKMAIYDAADLPPGDADVAGAQGTHTALVQQLGTAKTSRMAALEEAERLRLEAEAETERERIAGLVKSITDGAIKDAMDAIALVNNDSDDTTVMAAQNAVAAAKTAIDSANIPADEMATLHIALAVHEGALDAKIAARMDAGEEATRIAGIVDGLETEISAANVLVNGLNNDSSDEDVAAAQTAVADAKANIAKADIPPVNKTALTSMLDEVMLAKKIADRNQAIVDKKEADDARAALGKAMLAALGAPATPVGTTGALANIDLTTPDTDLSNGLTINAAAGAGALANATNPDDVTLTSDATGRHGDWSGRDYAHSAGTGDAMVTNEARVYANQGPDGTQPFSTAQTGGKYALVTTGNLEGWLELTAPDGAAPPSRARAARFNHQGTQNHAIPTNNVALIFSGTYDGADGQFRCTGTCTSANDGKDGPSELGGTWHFKPNAGAMVRQPDADYLYYGWWVSKDSDGDPTAASAFTGTAGTIAALTNDPVSAVTGSATYSGNAAGKFAMTNPLDGSGNGGHFTADAELTAKFGSNDAPNNGGVSGMIDNFRLNDGSDDPGWSVTLNRAPWGTAGAFTSSADTTNTTADGTVWSINGNAASESGSWSGQMYDELPGLTTATPPGDGSNIPTTVTGTFYSEFSANGRMVGAFGADKQ